MTKSNVDKLLSNLIKQTDSDQPMAIATATLLPWKLVLEIKANNCKHTFERPIQFYKRSTTLPLRKIQLGRSPQS